MIRFATVLLALLIGTGEARADWFGSQGGTNPTTATGSTTPRTLADRAAERLNVRDFGAVGDGTTDDSAAFTAAINAENTKLTAGTAAIIYVPPGKYRIVSTLPRFGINLAGAIVGEASWKSIIVIDPTYVGDLFSWSDAWGAGTTNAGGTSYNLPTKLGARAEHLTIIGDQTASSQQNAFILYDHDDFAYFNDIDVHFLHGRAFYGGGSLTDTASYLRESHIENFRAFNSGLTGVPVFELTSTCTVSCTGQDATNEIDISGVDIYGSRGPSFVIRNAAPVTGGTQRQIRLSRVRIEGTEANPNGVTADLMTIGDAAMDGRQATITCTDCELISPYTNFPALRLTSQTSASRPVNIAYSGMISQGGGGGAGLQIDAGAILSFRFTLLGTAQTGLTVAASPMTGGPIYVDGSGAELGWTTNIDTTALQYVRTPGGQFGVLTPASGNRFIAAQAPDSTLLGGNPRGMLSTDWQTSRFASAFVASGTNSTISGGVNNEADGGDATVAGGNQNRAAGFRSTVSGGFGNISASQYSTVLGGLQGFARNFGAVVLASGQFATGGDAQEGTNMIRGSGATASAFRLTADSFVGSTVTNNCINIQNNAGYALVIVLRAFDQTTPTKGYTASWGLGSAAPHTLDRGATAASTLVDGVTTSIPPDVFRSIGTLTGVASAINADTTLGCLNVLFTPPTGNTDTWHAVARVETVEVQ
jgi:hypothetical protein